MGNAEFDPAMFAIKYTNMQVAAPCAICGRVADPPVGVALFVTMRSDPVCDQCGAMYAPTLAALMRLYHTIKAEDQ